MEQHFIKTTLATGFETDKSISKLIIENLLFFIPKANPGYESKLHLVNQWVIEFDLQDLPYREIGLDKNGIIVLAGPNARDYGCWLDTNMEYKDFTGKPITRDQFETVWQESEVYRDNIKNN